jgi:hypothetical protein
MKLIAAKHARETVEKSRVESLTATIEDYKNREIQLANAIVQLQTHHCRPDFLATLFVKKIVSFCSRRLKGLKVKELEDLTDVQKNLLDKLRPECKTLASHIEDLQSKYK